MFTIMETHDFYNKGKWGRRKVKVVWDRYKNLSYINEPFNDAETLSNWHTLGFNQAKYTGDLYDMRQPEPNWMGQVKNQFTWAHFSWALYRMTPGCTLPNHSDTYSKYKKLLDIKKSESIHRAIIFLEDWQSGHYFEINDKPILDWQAGDCVWWQYDVPHIAANVGITDRYTLQITGIVNDSFL